MTWPEAAMDDHAIRGTYSEIEGLTSRLVSAGFVLETEATVVGLAVHPDGKQLLLFQTTGEIHPTPRVIFNWAGSVRKT